jgi:hypothetical protein
MDTIRITVLDDGTIKTDTDRVSMPNHANADGFLREVSRLAGGKTEIKIKGGSLHSALQAHTHDGHTHTHTH